MKIFDREYGLEKFTLWEVKTLHEKRPVLTLDHYCFVGLNKNTLSVYVESYSCALGENETIQNFTLQLLTFFKLLLR